MRLLAHQRPRRWGPQSAPLRLVWLFAILGAVHFLFLPSVLVAQITVSGKVETFSSKGSLATPSAVVWLVPLDRAVDPPPSDLPNLQLVQKNKSFVPHLLVVQAGSAVNFPNEDPFFHNVFSLFEGKRFDLGLYETGKTRKVMFDRPGVCYIFCNIHPQMSAVVVVLPTPYYGISADSGAVSIPGVPPGRYELHVWGERALPASMSAASRQITVSDNARSFGVITLQPAPPLALHHKNKYDQDYETPSPDNPVYLQP